MKLLLDTHVFIWLTGDVFNLSSTALSALRDPNNERFLSDASVWEMAIKVQLQRLKFPEPFEEKILQAITRTKVAILPIATPHVTAVSKLPLLHRDPFDRLLVVQAQIEGCTLVTHDDLVGKYNVPVLW